MTERRCILSGDRTRPDDLIRLAIGPDGTVMPDVRARAPGRGAWIGVPRGELEAAQAKGRLKGAFARAFKGETLAIPDDLPGRIDDALRKELLDRLGLEARSSTLITGFDKIDKAARRGQVTLLLHAADAGDDGQRKLDQAWRVGEEREGSDFAGIRLPVDRNALSMALGRDNVVHIAMIDARAGKRVRILLDRWQKYTGCANAAQNAAPADMAGATQMAGLGVDAIGQAGCVSAPNGIGEGSSSVDE